MASTQRPTAQASADLTTDSAATCAGIEADAASEADELAADAARRRYRCQPMQALAPDHAIAHLMRPAEQLLAVRASVRVERRQALDRLPGSALHSTLYLTSARLILIGPVEVILDVDEIEDIILSGERLLVILRDGKGLTLDVERPRLLRLEIANARAAARG